MKDAVQPPQLLEDAFRQPVEFRFASLFQIEREDRRLRPAGCFDLIVDGFEFLDLAPEQDDGRTLRGEGQRSRAAYALSGAGDQNHATLQVLVGGLVIHRAVRQGKARILAEGLVRCSAYRLSSR